MLWVGRWVGTILQVIERQTCWVHHTVFQSLVHSFFLISNECQDGERRVFRIPGKFWSEAKQLKLSPVTRARIFEEKRLGQHGYSCVGTPGQTPSQPRMSCLPFLLLLARADADPGCLWEGPSRPFSRQDVVTLLPSLGILSPDPDCTSNNRRATLLKTLPNSKREKADHF